VSQILTILRHSPALEFPLSADNILSKSSTLERHASDNDRLVVATLLSADLIHPPTDYFVQTPDSHQTHLQSLSAIRLFSTR
jgi:hypothetical protein